MHYYDYHKIVSYNCPVNVLIRRKTEYGKSYGAKKYIVSHFKKTGKQCVYIRRYNKELKEATMKKDIGIFFDQIKDEFPDDKLSNSSEVLYCNKKVCGYGRCSPSALCSHRCRMGHYARWKDHRGCCEVFS